MKLNRIKVSLISNDNEEHLGAELCQAQSVQGKMFLNLLISTNVGYCNIFVKGLKCLEEIFL